MADNVAITAGTGTTIAADEVTRNAISEKQQLIKISYGTDGNYEGMVSTTTPLPIGGTTAQCLSKAEDDAHNSGDVGVPVWGVRRDTASALTSTSGDYSALAVNSFGSPLCDLNSDFVQSIAKSPLKLEDAAHSSGDTGIFILGVANTAESALSGTTGDYTPLATDLAGRIKIDPGSAATSLGKLEDAAHSSGDLGVQMLAVRRDTATSTASANADYASLAVNLNSALIIDYNRTFQASDANGLLKAEDAAAVSADAGVAQLMVRADTPPSNAGVGTDGDYAFGYVNNEGAQYVCALPSSVSAGANYRNLDVNVTGVNIKASQGTILTIVAINRSTSQRYLKLYNKASAPTVGSDTPTFTYPLKPAAASGAEPIVISLGYGANFNLGIGIGATTGIADADTGAPSTNDVVVNITYK